MKRISVVLMFGLSILILTGCVLGVGKQTLTCSIEEPDDAVDTITTFEIVANNNVFETASFKVEMVYGSEYESMMSYIEEMTNQQFESNDYNQYKGIEFNVETEGTTITMSMDIDYDLFKTNENIEASDLNVAVSDYEAVDGMKTLMEKYETEGFTCSLK